MDTVVQTTPGLKHTWKLKAAMTSRVAVWSSLWGRSSLRCSGLCGLGDIWEWEHLRPGLVSVHDSKLLFFMALFKKKKLLLKRELSEQLQKAMTFLQCFGLFVFLFYLPIALKSSFRVRTPHKIEFCWSVVPGARFFYNTVASPTFLLGLEDCL